MSYWRIPIYGQPMTETTVQHVTSDDVLDPNIAVEIKSFDQALTECLDNIKFIINDFNGFVVDYQGSDMPQWDTQDLSYMDKKNGETNMYIVLSACFSCKQC